VTNTIELLLDLGDEALASVFVELTDTSYPTAKQAARRVSRAVGFRSVDAAGHPRSPWMYFGRAYVANRFRLEYPDRSRDVPDGATRIVVTRTNLVIALDEFDQATQI
jgi:hypothetical protein